jgi:hypothetical protein
MAARIEVRDPINGGRRALVVLRPVVLDRLEGLLAAKPMAGVLRERGDMRNVLFSVRKSRLVTSDRLGTSAFGRPSIMNSLKGHLLIATPGRFER